MMRPDTSSSPIPSICLLLTLLLSPALASAEPLPTGTEEAAPHTTLPKLDDLSDDQQRELASLIDLAESNAGRGQAEKALTFFQEAYLIFPHPQLRYRMALLQDQLGRQEEAMESYLEFSAKLPNSSEAPSARRRALELREALRERDIEEEATIGSLRILSSPPGAQVYFGDTSTRIKGSTPTVDLPIREAGTITIIVRKDGYLEQTREVTVAPGDRQVIDFSLKRDPNAPRQADLSASTRSRRAGNPNAAPIAFLTVGIVGAASAATFGYLWSQSYQGPNRNDYTEAQFQTKTRYETLTYVSGGVALVGFTGAILLWNRKPNRARAQQGPRLELAPWVSAHTQGASVHVSF